MTTAADRPGIGSSYQRLRAAQKSGKGAPLYSRLVNRPAGRVLAAVAHNLGLTPNAVTAISAVFTYAAIVCLFVLPPTPATAVIVTVGLVLGYALDAADGQLARLRGGGTLSGEWLDHVVDSGKIASLHLGVAVMMFRWYDLAPAWLLVPIGFSIFGVIHFFGMLLTEFFTRLSYARSQLDVPAAGTANTLVSALKLPTDYGILCLVFAFLALPTTFLVLYGLLGLATAGYTVIVFGVWYRRVRALDAGPTA